MELADFREEKAWAPILTPHFAFRYLTLALSYYSTGQFHGHFNAGSASSVV